jgi:hypothetical protein
MIALLVILFLGVSRGFGIEIFAEWTSLNFTWDSSHKYSEYLSTNQYIPTNCKIFTSELAFSSFPFNLFSLTSSKLYLSFSQVFLLALKLIFIKTFMSQFPDGEKVSQQH